MVAAAGSTGGILAVCIGKFRKLFTSSIFGPLRKTKNEDELTGSRSHAL